ncbi:MAG: 2-dehydropantoate 2-reductase [Aquificaceae bacterium]|nr:2-dehydropantoate 2-reductase [Aquificaceae bacterium]MCS7196069.1 2-dehydropantoate 2-reductase [Aquificaceae bacterium]MDW8032299.1 2-dehydropantoate 2-reductase [Aquificaceae bacterium]MDW8294429.1 2-dehydropantoate 2-reductase [Aquificaceae bacterium]
MKFLVVGVGALGSVYLAFLSRAGHRAVGLLKKGRVLQNISVEGIWGTFEQRVKVIDDLSLLDFEPDLVILTVKSYDTEQALKTIEPLQKGKSLLLVAQNGYGNYEKAVELFGEGRVILARVIFGAQLLGWGHVKVTVCGDDVVIGDPIHKVDETLLQELAKTFQRAGIPTRYDREVYRHLWDKILYNCALNPLGALFQKRYGELVENPYTKELMDYVIEEAFEVIKAHSIPTFWDAPHLYKEHFYRRLVPPTAEHHPSMLEDLRRGKTEIDALNGALVELGRQKGLALPTNWTIVKLIKAQERFNLGLVHL